MEIEIKMEDDENVKLIPKTEEKVLEEPEPPKVEKRQPTLENPKGHEWFNGTSWGLK
jgi:hypothetical protein